MRVMKNCFNPSSRLFSCHYTDRETGVLFTISSCKKKNMYVICMYVYMYVYMCVCIFFKYYIFVYITAITISKATFMLAKRFVLVIFCLLEIVSTIIPLNVLTCLKNGLPQLCLDHELSKSQNPIPC